MLGDWLKAACLSGDDYLPTSLNRTCIAVLDETGQGLGVRDKGNGTFANPYGYSDARIAAAREAMRQKWLTFRSNYPDRWFFLLQPGGMRDRSTGYGDSATDIDGNAVLLYINGAYYEKISFFGIYDLLIPQEFLDDPRAFYIPVHREAYEYRDLSYAAYFAELESTSGGYGQTGGAELTLVEIPSDPAEQFTSDWAAACSLHTLPNLAAVALYIDISGSLGRASIQDSYNQFVQYLNNRGMSEIVVTEGANQLEDWIGVFDKLLSSESASAPGGWNYV